MEACACPDPGEASPPGPVNLLFRAEEVQALAIQQLLC
jgi:hypothetical protein